MHQFHMVDTVDWLDHGKNFIAALNTLSIFLLPKNKVQLAQKE